MPESLLDYMSLKGVGRKINPNPVGLAIEQYGILNPPELNPDNVAGLVCKNLRDTVY